MESFSQITNKFIKSNDPNNKLKTVISVTGYNNSSLVYGQKFRIDVPRKYNKLAQVYLQLDVTNEPLAEPLTIATGFAAKIMSQINWKTHSGTVLQTITPQYTLMRLDELNHSDSSYQRIEVGMTPPSSFTNGNPVGPVFTSGACIVYSPLFLFISESKDAFLDTRHLEQTYFELNTAQTTSELGFFNSDTFEDISLTSIVPTLHFLYFDDPNTSLNDFVLGTKKQGLPKQLYNSYNTFYEEKVPIPTGATSMKMLLRCNYPLYNLHSFLINADSSRASIKKISLSIKGNYILREFDNSLNYTMFSTDKGFATDEAFSYWFSDLESRTEGSGLITFSSSDSLFPTYLEVFFDTAPIGQVLHVFEDYKTIHDVMGTGVILENNEGGKLQMKSNYL